MAQRFLEQLAAIPKAKLPKDAECMICKEEYGTVPSDNGTIEHAVLLPCSHHVGSECIAIWLSPMNGPGNSCPLCRTPFFETDVRYHDDSDYDSDESDFSDEHEDEEDEEGDEEDEENGDGNGEENEEKDGGDKENDEEKREDEEMTENDDEEGDNDNESSPLETTHDLFTIRNAFQSITSSFATELDAQAGRNPQNDQNVTMLYRLFNTE